MGKSVWKDGFVIDVYLLAADGLKNTQIAKAIGVSYKTFQNWGEKKGVFRTAVIRGRKCSKLQDQQGMSFRTYVYDRLSPKMQKLWDKINECEESNNGVRRIEALLKKRGKNARQHMFVYAWTESNFNTSHALKKANITYNLFKHWCENEPDFAKLIDEIHWHKKNFYEAGLTKLVADGNANAIIFANRTINSDRGYHDVKRIALDATVNTTMQGYIPIMELDLDIKTKKKVLDAIRKYKKDKAEVNE